MNPWDLSASDLLLWGIVAHLIADWPLQTHWMATNKMKRWGFPYDVWFIRHPSAYIHAEIHALLLAFVFGWVAFPIALAHLIIDTRWPVVLWSKLMRQTQPSGRYFYIEPKELSRDRRRDLQLVYDMGTEVRIWVDQVFHIICIAVAALAVSF